MVTKDNNQYRVSYFKQKGATSKVFGNKKQAVAFAKEKGNVFKKSKQTY